ncbi:hypothetical protein KP806_08020 [Paenibacillus sp. N4]|uniref:hypothetical protein n=1 Tax=Paenibacillus vietnamensis TaxID=2590547 RepID=UPI001CD126CC|nr:hypothetical protein [Paenibacillus vietnamensis]MCA0754992.1 hypothetical protein [Paenibacillus vietnamensis]
MADKKKNEVKRRKNISRKRLVKTKEDSVKSGQIYHNGFNAGFTKGFEDGHQLAYEQQP